MRAFKSLLVTTAIAGLLAAMSVRLFALPLPSLSGPWAPGEMRAGQSKLVNPLNTTDYITVDWIVLYDSVGVWGYPGSFVYMYQLENTAGSSGIRAFNVKYGGAQGNNDEIGIKAGDLDANNPPLWSGHNSTNFGNLSVETEPGGTPQGNLGNYNAFFPDPNSVSYTLSGITISLGRESLVLYIIDPRAPTYGEAKAQDSASWWGMVTLGGVTYGEPVPVPSPEPGMFMLLATSLAGILVWQRRSKK
ncbi:hypothetical protein HRbin17_00532 [bacterium HR17]|uniref:PEP-CTERM protein-sorting domain-containing protein n=1 Tax=Candidatus Fervidibacter japonicus TaxID=2035412 RepID=A0A2H5XAA1_9BACT|nr:hypothetical protein HRbin17_00532 [bacterium HR17]